MKPSPRFLLAPVVLIAATALTATAQDFSLTPVFTFLPAPAADEVTNPKDLGGVPNLEVRPNANAEFYLYAFNPKKVEKTYIVEVRGGPKTGLAVQTKVKLAPEKWTRIRLPKPAPPTAPPAAPAPAAPAAPGAQPAPAPEPPPPGSELFPVDRNFSFTIRLLAEDGKPETDPEGKPYGRVVGVTVQRPEDYIDQPKGEVTLRDTLTQVRVEVQGKPNFTGTSAVRLDFPQQAALLGAVVREGFYRRTLTAEPGSKTPPKATLVGAVENAGPGLRVDVGVDGFERAFIYKPAPAGELDAGQLKRVSEKEVRVFPAAGFATAAATQPVPRFLVRIEPDNDPKDATLELWVRQPGAGDSADVNEVIKLGGTRDERVWLDLAGPTDQGLLVTSKLRDWVTGIDLTALRGQQEVVAVMKVPNITTPIKSPPLLLTIDATPPEKVEFAKLPAKHIKGKPLPVQVSAIDRDTKIEKAVFFLGKPLEDGKLPPDAVKVDGVQSPTDPKVWTADIPLPPEKRGEVFIGVVFTDQVGLTTTRTQRVELIDAPPPAGNIAGVVMIGELPQPGLVVSLRDGDGKEKATTTTDDKGKFKFEKVAPGNYTVASSRKDSSYGSAGSAPVQVEVDKTAKVTLPLKKNAK